MPSVFRPWQEWGELIAQRLSDHGFSVLATDIVSPPNTALGDLAVPFFRLAKERGQSPADLARDAAQTLMFAEDVAADRLVTAAVAAGPYLNIRLADHLLAQAVEGILEADTLSDEGYGRTPVYLGAPVLFEYANPNTHKEIHIGHLRNFVTGVAFHSIWTAAGIPIKAVQFVNDQGVNVAKVLWMMVTAAGFDIASLTMEQAEGLLEGWPKERKTGNALGRIYVEAGQKLEGNDGALSEISYIQAQLEAHNNGWEFLWRETRNWCLQELQTICAEIGIVFDRTFPYLESDLIDAASAIVSKLEATGVARVSEGALIVDLEEDKLGVTLIRKSDGNLLYASKDLALAYQKHADWPGISQSFVLVDNRQSLHFKQLKAILKRLTFPMVYEYLDYGLLTLKEGTMSSRKGNIITYQMLRDALLDRALGEVSQRHPDWEPEHVEKTARAIAFGGMKFALLKQDPDSIITFDLEQALAFEGMTGPYCQYAVVRLRSILEKAGSVSGDVGSDDTAWLPAERELILAAGKLPFVVQQAAGHKADNVNVKETQPAVLAHWCFSMAQSINAFYRDVPVLDAEPSVRGRRVQIAKAAMIALTNGLSILTIDVPERM